MQACQQLEQEYMRELVFRQNANTGASTRQVTHDTFGVTIELHSNYSHDEPENKIQNAKSYFHYACG